MQYYYVFFKGRFLGTVCDETYHTAYIKAQYKYANLIDDSEPIELVFNDTLTPHKLFNIFSIKIYNCLDKGYWKKAYNENRDIIIVDNTRELYHYYIVNKNGELDKFDCANKFSTNQVV